MNVHHLRKWHRWQRASISTVARARRSRIDRNESEVGVFDDYSMTFVCVSTSVERDLCEVLSRDEALGKSIDAYLLRLLQHVARTSGVMGEVHLPDRMWGPTIFSRPWDSISPAKGKRILAAFKAAGIVVEGPAVMPEWLKKMAHSSRDESRDTKNARSGTSGTASGTGTEFPPLPPSGGDVLEALPNGNGKPLTERQWKTLGRKLAYAAVVHRHQPSGVLRRRLRNDDLPDHEAKQALDGLDWIDAKMLTNFERNG